MLPRVLPIRVRRQVFRCSGVSRLASDHRRPDILEELGAQGRQRSLYRRPLPAPKRPSARHLARWLRPRGCGSEHAVRPIDAVIERDRRAAVLGLSWNLLAQGEVHCADASSARHLYFEGAGKLLGHGADQALTES